MFKTIKDNLYNEIKNIYRKKISKNYKMKKIYRK